MSSGATDGYLYDDVPYVRIGEGPPLVMVLGLTPEHTVPEGWQRRMALGQARPLAGHFTVYVVNRKRGLRAGESMSDIAGHLAAAIEHDVGEPVFLEGTSTGGSVALQLALDRPDLVRRLVVVAAACRLGPRGRQLQADLARLTRAGRAEEAWAESMTAMLPWPLRGVTRPVTRLAGRRLAPDDPGDLLATIDAEDAFDIETELHRISAPTLVIGGGKDPFYPRDLFERTAAGVQDGRLHVFGKWGHGRTSTSTETAHLTLGFLLAGLPFTAHE